MRLLKLFAVLTFVFCLAFPCSFAQSIKHGSYVYYLDSGSKHYLQLDSIGFNKQTEYRVREFYRNTLLSSGKTNWLLDDNYLQTIQTYTVRTYQNHWYDTILLFNVFGDTLQYSYKGDIDKTFDIHYANNRRTEYERFGKNRVSYQWVHDGIIEKHYKHKRLNKLVLQPYDSAARTLYYQPKRYTTPYYSPSENLYFSMYAEDLTSVYPRYYAFGTKVSRKRFNVVYPSNQYNTYRTQHLYQKYPFIKRQYRLLSRKVRRRKDLEQLIFSKEYTTESVTSINYDMKGRIIHHKEMSLKSQASLSEQYLESRVFKSIYRYSSPEFHGHIYFKRHSFIHIDTTIRAGKTYITKGRYKNHFYYFKTYCNQSLYRHGKAQFYIGNKRPKGLQQYADKGFKMSAMEDLHLYIHERQYAETDTFFLGDTTLIFVDFNKIYLRTADTEKLLFDSLQYNTNRIVKDQAQCAVGVKTLNDKWLIPPSYDHIQQFQLPGTNVLVYFASINDYGILYNNKGQVMIPPTRGFSYKALPLSYYHSSALDVINQYAFICNDLTTDSFKLIDQFNRVVLQGAGQYTYIHNMLGIKHQGKMTLEALNTGREKHWFKDTMVFIGGSEVLLWEPNPDAQGRQLRLLNTATKQLEPDTFCYFYNREYNWGLESNKRRIYFSNNSISFIDSQLLPKTAFYHINDFMVIKNGDKHGIVEDGKIILQPEYDAIRLGALTHAALKDSSLYLIDRHTGKIIRNLGYHRLSTRMPNSVAEFPNMEISHGKITVIEIKKDGKFGLIDHRGNDILPCSYNYMSAGYNLYNTKVDNSGINIETWDEDSVFQTWQFVNGRIKKTFPKQPILYNDYKNHQSYLGFSGEKPRYQYDIIEQKTSQINPSITTFNIHQIVDTSKIIKSRYTSWDGGQGNRKLVGILDEKLEWIVRFDTFENIQDEKTFFYFMNKDKRCGVMDKNFNIVVPAKYHNISYDPKRRWLWHRDSTQTYWQLNNLHWDSCILDSVDYPISIAYPEQTGVISRNGYFGIMNDWGRITVPPIYERISENIQNLQARVYFKDKKYITKFGTQPYEKLYMSESASRNDNYGRDLIGIRAQNTYIVNYFNAIDSSNQLFMNRAPGILLNNYNYKSRLNKSYSSSPEIFNRKLRFLYLADYAGIEYRIWWHSPSPAASYPNQSMEGLKSQIFSGSAETWAPKVPTKDTLKTPNGAIDPHLQITDIAGQRLQFVSEGFNTLSYRGKQYLHLVFDSSSVYKFTLSEIIDPAKKDSLIHYLHKIWLKQENPNLTCVPANQIFDLFSNNFHMSGPYFTFLPRQLDLLVTIEEIRSFMSPEWAARF